VSKCIVCGEETDRPSASAFSHFYLYTPGQWKWLKGNMRTFGRFSGFMSTLYLAFPALNTLRHWKHRKSRLDLATDQSDVEQK
jgi:hypothetical protein